MKRKGVRRILIAALIILSFSVIVGFRKNKDESGIVTIVNVSYDPTRELFEKYNKLFQAHYASDQRAVRGVQRAVCGTLEGADRIGCVGYPVTWRLRFTGPFRNRRCGCRCSDTGL